MLLVPATMELLGDKNWWLPRWLDRILPTINIEGSPDDISEIDDDEPEADRELDQRLARQGSPRMTRWEARRLRGSWPMAATDHRATG